MDLHLECRCTELLINYLPLILSPDLEALPEIWYKYIVCIPLKPLQTTDTGTTAD